MPSCLRNISNLLGVVSNTLTAMWITFVLNRHICDSSTVTPAYFVIFSISLFDTRYSFRTATSVMKHSHVSFFTWMKSGRQWLMIQSVCSVKSHKILTFSILCWYHLFLTGILDALYRFPWRFSHTLPEWRLYSYCVSISNTLTICNTLRFYVMCIFT